MITDKALLNNPIRFAINTLACKITIWLIHKIEKWIKAIVKRYIKENGYA